MPRSFRCALCIVLCLALVTAATAAEVYLLDKKWGSRGTANGQFQGNIGLYLRGSRVYTTECDGARVQVFNLNGVYQSQFGTYGAGTGQFHAPRDLVVNALQQFFVLDSEDDCVNVFNSLFVPLSAWGSSGSGNLNFDAPWRVALDDSTNMLYVTDYLNSRVCQWSAGGVFQRTFGSAGSGNGQFSNAVGLAVDGQGHVYVADTNNRRIQVFSTAGVYQRQFQVGPVSNRGMPDGLAVAPDGHLFILDGGYGLVRKCTTYGTQVAQFGGTGTANGKFRYLDDIAVDASGRVFVSDGASDTSRVQRFVRNLVPTAVAAVVIGPKPRHDNDNLVAKISPATDGDGDPLTYQYLWYYKASGSATVWQKSRGGAVLPASYTTVGQYWRVKVQANDGKSLGPWRFSEPVTVVPNASPALALSASADSRAGVIDCLVTLSAPAAVDGTVSNLAGRVVAQVASRALPAGLTALTLSATSRNGTRLPAGAYVLRLTARLPDGQTAGQLVPVTVR